MDDEGALVALRFIFESFFYRKVSNMCSWKSEKYLPWNETKVESRFFETRVGLRKLLGNNFHDNVCYIIPTVLFQGGKRKVLLSTAAFKQRISMPPPLEAK